MRSVPTFMTALFASVALASGPLTAQDTNDASAAVVTPGTRIRFTMADGQGSDPWASRPMLLKGTVTQVRGDSLTVLFGGGAQLTVNRLAIGDLSVSRGTVRGWQTRRTLAALNTVVLAAGVYTLARWPEKPSATAAAAGARRPSIAPMAALVTLHALTFGRAAFRKTELWEPVTK